MSFTAKNFYGEIEGRNAYSFLGELNYDLKTSGERIECLKKVLYLENGYQHPFWERVFEQTFDKATGLNTSFIKLVLNTTDGLYSDTNICEILTKMTDYILFAEDVKAMEKAEKQEYKIYRDARLFEKMQRETSLEAELERIGSTESGEMNIDDLIHILVKESNSRKESKQVIYTKDFEDEEIGHVLKQYQHQINYMSNKLSNNKNEMAILEAFITTDESNVVEYDIMKEAAKVESKDEARKRRTELARESKMLMRQIGYMKQDLIDVKDQIKRPVRLKALGSGSTEPDYTSTDFLDPEVIKAVIALPVKETYDLQDDYELVQYTVNELLKDTVLTEEQQEVLKLYRKGIKQVEIARIVFAAPELVVTEEDFLEVEAARMKVKRTIDKVAKLVTNTFEENLKAYLVKRKPKEQVKVCKKCGKTKVKSDFYARKDSKDGLHSCCISCMQ